MEWRFQSYSYRNRIVNISLHNHSQFFVYAENIELNKINFSTKIFKKSYLRYARSDEATILHGCSLGNGAYGDIFSSFSLIDQITVKCLIIFELRSNSNFQFRKCLITFQLQSNSNFLFQKCLIIFEFWHDFLWLRYLSSAFLFFMGISSSSSSSSSSSLLFSPFHFA